MRIIVLSDTHGSYSRLHTVVMNNHNADAFIHLGDGEEEYLTLLENFPRIASKFHYVKGNCDWGSSAPAFKVIDIAPGHRIFAAHGDRYAVKYDMGTLLTTAKEYGCDIALYGHTHVRHCAYIDGIHVMNPGSAARPRDGQLPSYGFIDITPTGIFTAHVSL